MISVYLLLDSHRSHRFPQIFYSFTFKSHADFADDADFLPLKFPRRWSQPAKHGEGKKRAVPRRNKARSKLSPGGPIPQNMARALMPRQP